MTGTLFPHIEPYRHEFLRVSYLHTLYLEESGNPDGIPVVFIHGGPGGGTSPICRRFFDPERFRIILFDQRGCGHSQPHAELRENTTWHLVDDIEAIRRHLHIEQWLVFGGSWGSTLSLAYAITHPDRCLGLILRGIFLLRPQELDWFYEGGASTIFPDYWEDFLEPIPLEERHSLIKAYYRRLTDEDINVQIHAARTWAHWEVRTSRLYIPADYLGRFEHNQEALAFSRIECHYFINGGFFETDNWLLENIHKIRHIPASIVQGRYDMVCPPFSAWELHRAWPEADFHMIPCAGHSMTEPAIQEKLLEKVHDFSVSLKYNP
jgi:proline iminopeptidase